MSVPKQAAARLIGFAQNIESHGSAGALQSIGLGNLAGKSIEEICPQLLDVFCKDLPGGNADEAIARNAMADALAEMCEQLTGDETSFSATQVNDLVVAYITQTIFGRIVNDIGQGTIALPQSATDAVHMQSELVELIRGAVNDSIGTALSRGRAISTTSMTTKVDAIYEASFDYLSNLAED